MLLERKGYDGDAERGRLQLPAVHYFNSNGRAQSSQRYLGRGWTAPAAESGPPPRRAGFHPDSQSNFVRPCLLRLSRDATDLGEILFLTGMPQGWGVSEKAFHQLGRAWSSSGKAGRRLDTLGFISLDLFPPCFVHNGCFLYSDGLAEGTSILKRIARLL